MSRFKRYRKLS